MSGGGQGQSSSTSHLQSTRDFICHAGAGAGATAGAIAATFVCPLDVIKTRLQVHGLPKAPQSGPRGDSSRQLTIGANVVAGGGVGTATAIKTNPL